ncbi:hypothetical protein V6N11_078471 [Hibiscus sabdariffa]|uniref:Uncharacterized protein n=1 Tax=Hibiscus sabdariffa TaxID=183260 RepID=A0ABR2TGY4_9ROSI
MDEYKKVTDELCGAKVWWVASNVVAPSWPMGYYPEQEKSYCQLTVHKRYLEMITCVCLEHVVKEEKEKKEIIEDLMTFSLSKEFHARIEEAWKRGYRLYGGR